MIEELIDQIEGHNPNKIGLTQKYEYLQYEHLKVYIDAKCKMEKSKVIIKNVQLFI